MMVSESMGKWRSFRRWCRPGWLTGPIFGKELRVASRRRRQYVLRPLYILILAVFVAIVWISVVQYQGMSYQGAVAFAQSRMAAAGKRIVTTVVLFQFFAMQVLAVILLSSAISDEVYHRTLGVLMTTPINSLQIVMGKVLSRLLQLVLLLAISLPILAVVRVLGGVPWDYLLSSLCVTLTAALFAGSVSLYFSIRNLYAYGVILRTLFALACLYFILPSLCGVAVYYLSPRLGLRTGSLSSPLSMFAPILVSFNPYSSMGAITAQMLSPGGPVGFSLPLHCGLMLGLSALVLGRSVAVVRRVALRQAVGEKPEDRRRKKKIEDKVQKTDGRRQGTGFVRPPSSVLGPQRSVRCPASSIRRVVGPPVVWKELRAPFIQGIDRRNSYIGLIVAIVALAATYLASWDAKSLDEDFTHMAYVMLFVFLGGLVNIVFSATRITTEKESQSWSLLLTTPLSDGDILLGKALSAFRRCLPMWGLLAAHVILFTLIRYIHPVAILHLLVLVGWLTIFITGAGLYFSARFARTTSAVVASFALVTGLWIVGPILAGLLAAIWGKDDFFALYMWTHPATQIGVIMSGAAGWQNAHLAWRSLSYSSEGLSRSGQGAFGVARVTGILMGMAALYSLVGLVFFWRAKRCLRRRAF